MAKKKKDSIKRRSRSIRFSDAEWEIITRVAANFGIRPADWVRHAAVTYKPDPSELRMLEPWTAYRAIPKEKLYEILENLPDLTDEEYKNVVLKQPATMLLGFLKGHRDVFIEFVKPNLKAKANNHKTRTKNHANHDHEEEQEEE